MKTSSWFSLFLAASMLTVPVPPATADPTTNTPDPLGLEFVTVRPGGFVMGSPRSEFRGRRDEVQRRVSITRPFLLSAYELTQAQWRAVTDTNPSYLYICPDCPVERISWYDVVEFCNAASRRAGFEPAYVIEDSVVTWNRRANGYRLPTEAEWEYACRAGKRTPFATGRCLDPDEANFKGTLVAPGCSTGMWRGQAVAVGSFAPNSWGLYDMHGNVAEWCWDVYAAYDPADRSNPAGPAAGHKRVLRGGSFDRRDTICRSACRQSNAPINHSRYLGVRLARTLP